MSDPRRLAEYGDRLDGLVRGALDAEHADGADASRLAGVEAKLAQRLAALPEASPPPAAPFAPKAAWLIGAAALVGVAALVLSQRTPPVPPPPPPPPPVAQQVAPPAPTAPAEPAIATVSPADLPTARDPITPASARSNVREPSPEQAEGEEIALLARAHEALPGRPTDSLALCREHEQRFVSGHFAQEREAVAIEALVYLNRKPEAERRFASFLARYPTSSHRGHLEDLFAVAPSPR